MAGDQCAELLKVMVDSLNRIRHSIGSQWSCLLHYVTLAAVVVHAGDCLDTGDEVREHEHHWRPRQLCLEGPRRTANEGRRRYVSVGVSATVYCPDVPAGRLHRSDVALRMAAVCLPAVTCLLLLV